MNPESAPLAWPDTLADQIVLVRGVIQQTAWQQADGAKTFARHFTGIRIPIFRRLVGTRSTLGHVGQVNTEQQCLAHTTPNNASAFIICF
jgi:hypothetical protein